jgi:amidase
VELADRLEKRALDWFGDTDAWLMPTVAVPPPRVGAWTDLDPEQTFAEASALGVFTAVFNVTGQPAASVPAGVGPDNLPYGVQLAGRPARDADVLALALQIETVRPWSHRQTDAFQDI